MRQYSLNKLMFPTGEGDRLVAILSSHGKYAHSAIQRITLAQLEAGDEYRITVVLAD